MSFTDYKFILFFVIVYMILLGFKFLKKNINNIIVKGFLLLASYILMFLADFRYCLCIFLLTFLTYQIGLCIVNKNNKKFYLIIGVIISLVQLGVFKYFNFFVESICNIIGKNFISLNIIVPIGVSFYTFSSISYLVDIYRKKCSNQSFVDYALYISFFPKLACGPIVKPNVFFEQLNNKAKLSFKNFETGIQVFMIGMFKKMVLADNIGVFVDDVFNYSNAFDSVSVWLGVFAYSLQIYFDFSGYSDMAIGISKILGFEFDKNFDLPYFSLNPTEFWKRWHISLSSWLQEYLYIPLGGNRKGKVRTYINLFLTMLIGGLWHGASWNFIIWGALNGIGLIIHKVYNKFKTNKFNNISSNYIYKFACIILTFLFTTFCWIFFRAEAFTDAINIIIRMFNNCAGVTQLFTWVFVGFGVIILEIIVSIKMKGDSTSVTMYYPKLKFNNFIHLTIFFIFCGLTIILAYVGETQFIYGNF